jgi:uncharacterized protein YdcH (DUF465 family)
VTITLAQLRTQARQRSDMESSQFVSDSELNSYINNSVSELYDILSDAYGSEYFVTSTAELPIIAGTGSYALPSDFYQLKGVDIKLQNQDYINIKRFNFNERNKYSNFNIWEVSSLTNVRYRIVGNNLVFSPTPDQAAYYRIWYTPLPTVLSADGDTLNDFNAYSEYVIVDAAIKMLQKEESDVSVLFAQKQALEKRIREKAQSRDANSSETITDVYAEADDYFFRRGV